MILPGPGLPVKWRVEDPRNNLTMMLREADDY